jgi:ABC-2 type transport system permease protein
MVSFRRILAILLRHLYLLKHSVSRWIDLLYWPTIDLLLWGFVSLYIQQREGSGIVYHFLGALILWNILIRAQQGLAVGFLEDVWARNLLHLFASPLTLLDYVLGLLIYSILKAAVASLLMGFLGVLIFDFNFFTQGLALFNLTFALLLFAWSVGLITIALVLYFGQEAEIFAWALALLFLPFSAVFYPVSVLPPLFQEIAKFVPTSYVFEGMRMVFQGKEVPLLFLFKAYLLILVYLILSVFIFSYSFKLSKVQGKLTKIGE